MSVCACPWVSDRASEQITVPGRMGRDLRSGKFSSGFTLWERSIAVHVVGEISDMSWTVVGDVRLWVAISVGFGRFCSDSPCQYLVMGFTFLVRIICIVLIS